MFVRTVGLVLVCSIHLVAGGYHYKDKTEWLGAEGLLKLDRYLTEKLPNNETLEQNYKVVHDIPKKLALSDPWFAQAIRDFRLLKRAKECDGELTRAIASYQVVTKEHVRWHTNWAGKKTKEVMDRPKRLTNLFKQQMARFLPVCVHRVQEKVLGISSSGSKYNPLLGKVTAGVDFSNIKCPWDDKQCPFKKFQPASIVSEFCQDHEKRSYTKVDESKPWKEDAKVRSRLFEPLYREHITKPCEKLKNKYGQYIEDLKSFLKNKIAIHGPNYADILASDPGMDIRFKKLLFMYRFCDFTRSFTPTDMFIEGIELRNSRLIINDLSSDED